MVRLPASSALGRSAAQKPGSAGLIATAVPPSHPDHRPRFGGSDDPAWFAARLNRLIGLVTAQSGRALTLRELCELVRNEGGKLSPPYLTQLLTGHSPRPSYAVVHAIARALKVDAAYFTPSRLIPAANPDIAVAQTLRNAGTFDLMRRAANLPPEERSIFMEALEQEAKDTTLARQAPTDGSVS